MAGIVVGESRDKTVHVLERVQTAAGAIVKQSIISQRIGYGDFASNRVVAKGCGKSHAIGDLGQVKFIVGI